MVSGQDAQLQSWIVDGPEGRLAIIGQCEVNQATGPDQRRGAGGQAVERQQVGQGVAEHQVQAAVGRATQRREGCEEIDLQWCDPQGRGRRGGE
jgi:hypothetical protein